ncbi:g5221 [Coccomyxa viridis]|uniref:G5221 protein n=1 Tax=Coccomyxa viridis TaxID=1274662 RepID=A0ABP1FS93_9CHLO
MAALMYVPLADEACCAVQYYNGQWTYHPQVKLGISSLSATRDLIEQSLRTQLLSLKPNVTIAGGAIAESLLWDEQKTRVQGQDARGDREVQQELLFAEIQQQIDTKQLRPMARTQYLRTAFQFPLDSTVRVSLDINLTMTKKNPTDSPTCTVAGRWYRDLTLPQPRTEVTGVPHGGPQGGQPRQLKGRLGQRVNCLAPGTDLATVSSPAPGSQDMIAYEQRAGLRPKHDMAPDKEKRQQMRSKKDYVHEEDVRTGRQRGWVNVVEGLELHKNLLSLAEPLGGCGPPGIISEEVVEQLLDSFIQHLVHRLTSRITQRLNYQDVGFTFMNYFLLCRHHPRGGIIPEEAVEPMPDLLVALVKRLVRWGVLPAETAADTMMPSSASKTRTIYVGSCLVLKGNGADAAMHCVPPISEERMMGPLYADQVYKQAERAAQPVQRMPRSWANAAAEEAPRHYGADDWDKAEGDNDDRLQRF